MIQLVRSLFLVALLIGAGKALLAADAKSGTQLIDREIQAGLNARKVPPSGLASDAEFIRRAYLDLHGVIPPADQVTAFLDSQAADKRAMLIDELLASEAYGKHQGGIWARLLLPAGNQKNRVPKELLAPWLAKQFNDNRPWNQLVYDLLTASAPKIRDNPAMIYLLNDSGTLKPEEATDLVSSVFMGVNLKCAQCHNHPFSSWKKTDYWGMAGFFKLLSRDGVGVGNIRGLADKPNPRLKLPEYAAVVPPKFLGGAEPPLDPQGPYRPTLARWLTADNNPYFARAMVNRTWAHFFGRGLIHPLDDLREDNPPTHPELLRSLTDQFIAGGYDLKQLIRSICNSQAYQRTSQPLPGQDADDVLLARAPIRVLSPEQLFDSLAALSVIKAKEDKVRKEFMTFFRDDDARPTEYDRGIPHLLRLANSPQLDKGRQDLAKELVSRGPSPAAIIERMYLTVLARRPTPTESQRMLTYVQGNDPARAYADILWVLLNSSEFTLNH